MLSRSKIVLFMLHLPFICTCRIYSHIDSIHVSSHQNTRTINRFYKRFSHNALVRFHFIRCIGLKGKIKNQFCITHTNAKCKCQTIDKKEFSVLWLHFYFSFFSFYFSVSLCLWFTQSLLPFLLLFSFLTLTFSFQQIPSNCIVKCTKHCMQVKMMIKCIVPRK